MNVDTEAILALPAAEKIELISLLWDNLETSEAGVSIPDWADAEAARRRNEMLADPSLGSTHEETWANIDKRNE